jgi:hypothetical protein
MYKADRATKTLLVLLVIGVWGVLLKSVSAWRAMKPSKNRLSNQCPCVFEISDAGWWCCKNFLTTPLY